MKRLLLAALLGVTLLTSVGTVLAETETPLEGSRQGTNLPDGYPDEWGA